MAKIKVGVLASGRGSNLQAIIDAVETKALKVELRAVISDNKEAYALERARQKGIAAYYIDPKTFAEKEHYEAKIIEELHKREVNLVVLAGYMRLVGNTLLEAFPSRIINIHPALLPAFAGLHGQKQAFDYGVRYSGCTVHFVDAGMDTGPIILQAVVPVLEDDTEESLATRILKEEHKIYPQAIKLYAEGKLKIEGRKVRILGE